MAEKTENSRKVKRQMDKTSRNFREAWRFNPKLKDWLEYNYDESRAYCKYCNNYLECKKTSLLVHAKRSKHVNMVHVYRKQQLISMPSGKRTVEFQTNLCVKGSASSHSSFSLIGHLSLAKCLQVISLRNNIRQTEYLARLTLLSIEEIEEILHWKEHIKKIYEYVPNQRIQMKFVKPNDLNDIIAMTEILNEFMRRIMRQNANITDEELKQNAKLLSEAFCVTCMKIDDEWTQFFRNKFKLCNPIGITFERKTKKYCYVRNILIHIHTMLDPEVVARFDKNVQNNSHSHHLILKCAELCDKQNKAKNQVHQSGENQKNMTVNEESEELCIKEEIELGEYTINENINKMPNENEAQNVWMHMENANEEFMTNDDSSVTDNFYTVSDVGDDENLMMATEQAETIIDTTQKKMYEECYIKQENEDGEYTATETGVSKHSQELFIDHIKAEPIEMNIKEEKNPSENIKEEFFEDSQEMQSLIQHIHVEPLEPDIKQHPSERNAYFDRNENNKMQSPIQCWYKKSLKSELNKELNEVNACYTNNEYNYIDHEVIEETLSKTQKPMESLESENDDSVPNKEQEINYEPKDLDINVDESMLHTDIITKLQYGTHLKEQRAVQIANIFNGKPYGKLCCEILWLDPIICTYMQIMAFKGPHLSVIALRMCLIDVLDKELYGCQYQYNMRYQPSYDDVKLYKLLVLLAYSTKYKWVKLKDIVKGVFNEIDLAINLNNSFKILEEWRKFFKKHFLSILYRKAAYEMLFEYETRYLSISTIQDQKASTNDIQKNIFLKNISRKNTTKRIQHLLSCDFELERNWQRGYAEWIKKNKIKSPNVCRRLYTLNDLCLTRIYEDIKEVLPKLVVLNSNVCCPREKDTFKFIQWQNHRINKKVHKDLIIKKEQNDKMYSKRSDLRDLPSKKSENIIEREQLLGDFTLTEPPEKKRKEEKLTHKPLSNMNFEDMSYVNSKYSESSNEIELLINKINKHASDVITEETIEIANITSRMLQTSTSLTEQHLSLVRRLHNDPIIAEYLKMLKFDYRKLLPVYSETIMRQAFNEIFNDNNIGQYSECQPQDLQLYSKLILLYYSDHVRLNTKLVDIMICFDETSIKDHLANASNIIMEWIQFFKKNLSRLLYKQAIYEMLYEYMQRYLRLEKEISDEVLMRTAKEIQRFLRCHIILPDQWLEHFRALCKSRLHRENYTANIDVFNSVHTDRINKKSSEVNRNYLDFLSIYWFVMHELNFAVTDTLARELGSLYSIEAAGEFKESLIIKKQIGEDPIIRNYFLLSNAKERTNMSLPVFNENFLRSSFNKVFINYKVRHLFKYDYCNLYRQLILFKYAEQYSSIADLLKVMICFSEASIRLYFSNYLFILRKWQQFTAEFLSALIFEQALYDMLYEFALRFMHIYGQVTANQLKRKSEDIKLFFDQNCNLPADWLLDFNKTLIKKLAKSNRDTYANLSNTDLELESIYESLKHRLHFTVKVKRDLIVASGRKEETILSVQSGEKGSIVMENIIPIKQYVGANVTRGNDESDAQADKTKAPQESCEYTNEVGTQESPANDTTTNATLNSDSFKKIAEIYHHEETALSGPSKVLKVSELYHSIDCETCMHALKRDLKKLVSKNSEEFQKETRIPANNQYQQYFGKKSDDNEVQTQNSEISLNGKLKLRAQKLNQQYFNEKSDENEMQTQNSKICLNGRRKKLKESEEIICRITDYKVNDEVEIKIIVLNDTQSEIK